MSDHLDVAVRLATAADSDLLRRHSYIDPDRTAAMIGAGQVAVAERGGTPVGFLVLDWLVAVQPFVALVWVLEEHRRRGVGSALLRWAEGRARARGCPALYSSSQADEPPPQAWHRRQGFEECGFIAGLNHGGIGEVLFRKRLT